MNDLFSFNSLLFGAKWVFVGLIYSVLLLVVVAVRREMSLRLGAGKVLPSTAPGSLRILARGTDPKASPGDLLPLGPVTRLGASSNNELVLQDDFISAHHARLRWDGASWWVEDLGSTNGTFVDDGQCVPHHPHPLPAGDRLRLGDMVFELVE